MGRIAKGILAGFATMVAFVVLVVIVGANNKRTSEELAEIPVTEIVDNLAAAANGMAGRKVAANVVVERATVENGTRLTYHYSIPNLVDDQYDHQLADTLIEEIKRKVCSDRMMRRAVDGGAEIRYAYRDGRGVSLFMIEIDQFVCARIS
jgi:hypothetical protein